MKHALSRDTEREGYISSKLLVYLPSELEKRTKLRQKGLSFSWSWKQLLKFASILVHEEY